MRRAVLVLAALALVAGVASAAHRVRARHARPVESDAVTEMRERLREQAEVAAESGDHGCGPDFTWSDYAEECYVEGPTFEVDCDTARAAQATRHVIAVEVAWPEAEVGEVILIDVASAIGDRWIAYCESTEPGP